MKKYLPLFFAGLFIAPALALAQATPSVTSLQASVSSINSGQPAGFSWSLSGATGSAFLIPCQNGVKASYADGSGFLSCDVRYSLSNTSGDAASLLLHNVSGSTKTITFKVFPKNSSGDYDANVVQTQVTVYPLQEPITSASLSPFSPTSGSPATLSWIGQIIDGVNITIDCSSYVSATSSSYNSGAAMPCGIPIFSPDLGATGSIPITFTNTDGIARSVTIKILPSISQGLYDGTHAKVITTDIEPYIAPQVQIGTFSASSSVILSESEVKVSWSASNVLGMNIRLSCNSSTIIATSSASPGTSLSCNQAYIGDTLLPSSGSLSFNFKNTGFASENVTVNLIPSLGTGTYDGTRSQTLFFTVLKKGDSLPYSYSVTTPSQGTPGISSGGTLKKARLVFTRALRVGFQGDDVKALQEFFAQDPAIYPEGLTTGYFGPATLRAIQRFQTRYGIATSGTPETTGYGALGPKTRAAINAIK